MKIIVWLLIVYAMASIVKAQPGTAKKKICGDALSNFLSRLCRTYPEPDLREKKSDDLDAPGYHEYKNGATLNQLYDLYLETVITRPFRHRRFRRHVEKRGIVEECCEEACSIESLFWYCSS